ncbi:MAG: thioether cross-link-forming SCIFF peptide maturase [Clostridiales bacterium]|nr:thioether cross-link-forming SCIFF peptide maturase [Clostridiales bacterium]
MIHSFTQNGITLVVDVYSGSVHVVDEQAAELIHLYENRDREEAQRRFLAAHPDADAAEVIACLDEIDALAEAGKLYAGEEAVHQAAQSGAKPSQLKALCLNVAHTCNLTCSYCFAGQGEYKGEQALMPFETGKAALDLLVRQSGPRRHLEVDFFGGEPLLNWAVVKQLVAYGRSLEQKHNKRFRFTLTTNGVLVDDEVIDFCNREMHNVVLSLDGRPEVHDRFRVDHMGRGSYERIVPKFQEFVRRRGDKGYYIRGTYTRHNLDFVNDVLHMADLGFTQLSMEPMVAAPGDPEALRPEDLPALYGQYELLADRMLQRRRAGRGFDFYHYLIDLERGPCLHKRISGCGSGTEYLAVTPSGELYPCHQFIGDAAYRMGDVWSGVTRQDTEAEFAGCNLASKKDCADCWAKLYCAGGCAANAFHATGSILGVDNMGCDLFRKRLECALMMQAALALDKENASRTA